MVTTDRDSCVSSDHHIKLILLGSADSRSCGFDPSAISLERHNNQTNDHEAP